jgi:hypothetical protein
VVSDISFGLIGANGASAVGNVGASISNALLGNIGAGSLGALTPSIANALSGVAAAGQVGTVSTGSDTTIALTGVSATGQAGIVAPSTALLLTGASGTAQAGNVGRSVTVGLSGVGASGQVGDLSAGAVSGGGGGYDYPIRKRHVVRVGKRLLEFSSETEAANFLALQEDRKDHNAPAEPVKQQDPPEPIAAPQPSISVPISQLKRMAADHQALDLFKAQIKAMEYAAIMRMYEDWQDEEDVELLLMAL